MPIVPSNNTPRNQSHGHAQHIRCAQPSHGARCTATLGTIRIFSSQRGRCLTHKVKLVGQPMPVIARCQMRQTCLSWISALAGFTARQAIRCRTQSLAQRCWPFSAHWNCSPALRGQQRCPMGCFGLNYLSHVGLLRTGSPTRPWCTSRLRLARHVALCACQMTGVNSLSRFHTSPSSGNDN